MVRLRCRLRTVLLMAVGLPFLLSPAIQADELLDTYVARLSANDHFNSKGKRLRSVAAIMRQDRANYHKFGIRDSEDTGDDFFSNKSNRAILERMLNRGYISEKTKNAILNKTPLILVQIFDDYVKVYLE